MRFQLPSRAEPFSACDAVETLLRGLNDLTLENQRHVSRVYLRQIAKGFTLTQGDTNSAVGLPETHVSSFYHDLDGKYRVEENRKHFPRGNHAIFRTAGFQCYGTIAICCSQSRLVRCCVASHNTKKKEGTKRSIKGSHTATAKTFVSARKVFLRT